MSLSIDVFKAKYYNKTYSYDRRFLMDTENKTKRVPTRVHTRKIDRMVARNLMKASGRVHVTNRKRNRYGTKKDRTHGSQAKNLHYSYFSKNWRQWAA